MLEPARTLDQRRAAHAWNAVMAVAHDTRLNSGYAREAKRLSMRIGTAGLGQSLAFLRAKAGRDGAGPNTRLLKDLGSWVLVERFGRPRTDDDAALLRAIVNENALFLRQATAEALAYLRWLNRFAEAEIGQTVDD